MSILVVSNTHFTRLFERARNGEADAFQSMLDSLIGSVEIAGSAASSALPQTVDDVKAEFYAFLECLTFSRGLAATPIAVSIDDAAFERMLEDPKDKQRMMDLCARDLSHADWTGLIPPASIGIHIDDQGEYLCRCWEPGADDSHAPRAGTFWNRLPANDALENFLVENADERREMWELLFARATEEREFARGSVESQYEAQGVFG